MMRGAGGPRTGLHVRVGGLLRLGLVLACTLVEPLSLPRMSVGAGWGSGPGQGAAVVARSSGMLRLRGGVRFEEVLTAMDMIQLPLDNKGAKKKRRNPITPIERDIAQVLFALREEPGLRMLKYLHIVSAQEMEISKSKERAVVMFIPYVEMMEYRKIQSVLDPKLMEKFKAHIVWIRHRRILPRERTIGRLLKQKRPMSRTLTAVHNAYLEDIIYPYKVVSRWKEYDPGVLMPTHIVFLDPKVRSKTEGRLEMYKVVYNRLTARKCTFDYLLYADGSELLKQYTPNVMPADTAGYINPPQASLHLEDVLASFRDEEGNELGEEEAKDVQELLKVGEPEKLPKWRTPFRIRKLPPGFVAPGSVNPPKLREVQFGRYIGPDGQEVTMEDEGEESEDEDDYEDDEEEVRAQTPRDRAYQRVEEEEQQQQKGFVEEFDDGDDGDNEVDDDKDEPWQ